LGFCSAPTPTGFLGEGVPVPSLDRVASELKDEHRRKVA